MLRELRVKWGELESSGRRLHCKLAIAVAAAAAAVAAAVVVAAIAAAAN